MIPEELRNEVNSYLHDLGRHVHVNTKSKNMGAELLKCVNNLKSAIEQMDKITARTEYIKAIFHLSEIGFVFKLSKDFEREND